MRAQRSRVNNAAGWRGYSGFHLKIKNSSATIKAMVITLIIFGLIMVVAYFARQKITSWRTYAAIYADTLSAA
jgi:hypothetical protein